MDQSKHSIPNDLYARLGTNCLTEGAYVCCVSSAIDAERLVLHVSHCSSAMIEKRGKDLPSAAVVKLMPLAGTACKP
jgi:hypothetical protein